jgi:glucokinase
MIIFAGDIGGTKTNFGFYETGGAGGHDDLRALAQGSVLTGDFPEADAMLTAIVRDHAGGRAIDAAAFGIAGPVEDGVCRGENLPWASKRASEEQISQALGLRLRRVTLLNDLAATAAGVRFLKGDQIVTIHEGERKERGNIAVIAAGTGLGEAGLVWHAGQYEPLAMEGGHTDLAVRNELEIELFKYLMTLETPVNQEAVLCGSGLFNVYNFFKVSGRAPEPDWLAKEIAAASAKDKPGLVSKYGQSKKADICVRALDLFMSMYGARAGNLAMTIMSTGGVFVGGGIAPKNLAKIKDGTFMAAFVDKGHHFRPIVSKFPVYVILEQKTALIGAAHYAAAHA